MRISLIVSTYNWPEALHLCLKSIMIQTRMPDEVIIADDGSKDETKTLIENMQKDFPCKLVHAWIPDEGFRLALSRNNAIRTYCTGDYVIFIDQDIILDKKFIEDHERLATKGCFVIGGRTKLSALLSKRLLSSKKIKLGLFTKGIIRKVNMVHIRCLFPVTSKMYSWNKLYGRGANMAMFKSDLEKVNGFDEDIVGYGVEDIDLFNRLMNNGINKKYAQFCAIEHHLYHKRGKVIENNFKIAFTNKKRKKCKNGLTHDNK